MYNDLPHPPSTSIGPQYAYRTADGSNNNPAMPDLGKAGTPYARSVQQTHPLPRNEMPDAGLVFDTLLRREKVRYLFLSSSSAPETDAGCSAAVRAPSGRSVQHDVLLRRARHPHVSAARVCPSRARADLCPRSVFRTSHKDVHINDTSSYIDLAPLYGHNQDAQDKVRVGDGRGSSASLTFRGERLVQRSINKDVVSLGRFSSRARPYRAKLRSACDVNTDQSAYS